VVSKSPVVEVTRGQLSSASKTGAYRRLSELSNTRIPPLFSFGIALKVHSTRALPSTRTKSKWFSGKDVTKEK
jgi:hypothetical protein